MKNLTITPYKEKFNIKDAKKCGAKTRKSTACQSPAMKNGRCRMHGGKSTGARTEKGIERIKKANFRNGLYTKEMMADKKCMKWLMGESNKILKELV